MLDNAIGIASESRHALRLLLQVREDVHASGVEPAEERLVALGVLLDELEAGVEDFLVDGFHALDVERTGVLDLLRAIRIRGGTQHAARTEFLLELRILRVVRVLGLLLRVQVIQVAEELVEAVNRRQELIAIAEMVLAELAAHVAERLERVGYRRVLGLQSEIGAGQSYL